MTTKETNITTAAQAARDFIDKFSAAFIERDRESNALLLATVAELPVVLLGPPGTGKSMLINTFSKACQGQYFQYLLTRFTTPDELFGQFKISALKKDKLERAWKGTIVDSKFIFLDEVFKASSALQNSLLTALNEKKADVGNGRIDMQYELIAGASNELPEEGVGLEALWDRWAIRLWVEGIATDSGFERLATDNHLGDVKSTLDMGHITILRKGRDSVDLTPVLPLLVAARAKLQEQGIKLSDRKWVAVFRAVKAKAVLSGRQSATRKDLSVIKHMAWGDEGQINTVAQICNELAAGRAAMITKLTGDLKFTAKDMLDIPHMLKYGIDIADAAYGIGTEEGWDGDCQEAFVKLLRTWIYTLCSAVQHLNDEMAGFDLKDITEIAQNMSQVGAVTTCVRGMKETYKTQMSAPAIDKALDGLRVDVMRNNELFAQNTNKI